MLEVNPRLRIPLREFSFQFVRSSGPGGQNVNKLNTKVVLRWPVADSPSLSENLRERFQARFANRITSEGELVLSSDRFRVRERNIEDCLEKLAAMLREVASPPRARKPTRMSRATRERRMQEKRTQGEKKRDRRRVDPKGD